jgi:hypothetical protein
MRVKHPRDITCANCQWYLPADSRQGECRLTPSHSGYRWVLVRPHEWCSQAKEAKAKPEAED